MFEALIAVGMVAVLVLVSFVPPAIALVIGLGLTAGGLVVGVPAGALYHVRLHRVLAPRDELSADWLWKPTANHERLEEHERVWVLWPFAIGAIGATASVVGAIVFAAAAIRGGL